MPNYRSPNHNRLLALEQELLAKKRWAKQLKSGQNIDSLKKKQTRKVSGKRHVNNRLLQLEQDILGKYRSKESQTKTSQARTLRVEKHKSDRIISSKNKSSLEQQPQRQKPKSKGSRVKSQVFDTGEAIILQYNSEVFPIPTPPTPVISLPEKTSMVETLPIQDLPVDREKSAILSIDDSDKSPSLTETSISDKIEASTPELPVVPETVVSNSKISTETDRETEDSLSQAAELISKIDTQPYPLQAEDIPPIIAELESDRPEAPTTPVPPQKESQSDYSTSSPSDRKNTHDIFDRMGKNMAYATTFDVGTIELEQLFDEFDRTLDREEQANQDNTVSQEQDDLELERRFDEFDRTLDREENRKTATEPTSQTKSLPEILSEETNPKTEKPIDIEPKETDLITSKQETEEIHNQNQQSLIAPITSDQGESSQPLSYGTQFDPNTPPKFDFKLEASLFRTGINLILLILRWLNLLRHKQIELPPEIDSRSTLFPVTYGDDTNNGRENPEEMLPPLFSIMRSLPIEESTPVDALTPNRDPLTGMPHYEFTEQNSYPSIDYPNPITAENKSNPNRLNLDKKTCDSSQEGEKDSS